ncbi:hypothetical protein ACOMHN_028313 [Nucella lapillus]
MALNGVLITNSENTYPYRAMLETLLTYGPDAQKCGYLECCLFASDTPGHMDATTGDDNRGLKHRRNASARSQTIDLMELDAKPSYEVNEAIKQMTTGKAPGPDAIPAEVYKTGGETIRNQLTSLFQSMWKQEHLPQEFRTPQLCTTTSVRKSPVL